MNDEYQRGFKAGRLYEYEFMLRYIRELHSEADERMGKILSTRLHPKVRELVIHGVKSTLEAIEEALKIGHQDEVQTTH